MPRNVRAAPLVRGDLEARRAAVAVNAMVFTDMCQGCQVLPTGTPGTVQRFSFDHGTGQWTRTEHAYPQLVDIGLSQDESTLLVLTTTQLLLVDPQTMATAKAIALPGPLAGAVRELAVMNDGLVIVDGLEQAYSPRADAFVPVAGLSVAHDGIEASRDGSRAIFGAAVNDGSVPYRYYEASTGKVVISRTAEHYARAAYSRQAEKAFVNSFVLDADLVSLGTLAGTSATGDISPDGNRIYALDFSTNPYHLSVIDVSGPFTELRPILIGERPRGSDVPPWIPAASSPSSSRKTDSSSSTCVER